MKSRLNAEQQKLARKIRESGPDPNLIRKGQQYKADSDLVYPTLNAVMANLKVVRESAGLSLSQMQERTGISKGSLSLLENGKGNPTFATIRRIADALGCKLSINVSVPEESVR